MTEESKECPSCRSSVQGDAPHCPHCGWRFYTLPFKMTMTGTAHTEKKNG
jgi:hypothetical protein